MRLRILAAAYEVALGYDYCPDEAPYSRFIAERFSEEEISDGLRLCRGMKRIQIASEIIEEIASLKDAQELLKTYNRWRRGEEINQPDVVEVGKAIDKLTL